MTAAYLVAAGFALLGGAGIWWASRRRSGVLDDRTEQAARSKGDVGLDELMMTQPVIHTFCDKAYRRGFRSRVCSSCLNQLDREAWA